MRILSACASFGSTLAKTPSDVERFLRVNSAWAGVEGADGDLAITCGAREIKAFCDLKLDVGVTRFDEDKLVAKEVPARFSTDELGLFEVIHPFEIGGNENIGRCPLFDLFRKDGGGCVSDRRGLAGVGFPRRCDRVERRFHAGGRKDHDGLIRRRAWRASGCLAYSRTRRKYGRNNRSGECQDNQTSRRFDFMLAIDLVISPPPFLQTRDL